MLATQWHKLSGFVRRIGPLHSFAGVVDGVDAERHQLRLMRLWIEPPRRHRRCGHRVEAGANSAPRGQCSRVAKWLRKGARHMAAGRARRPVKKKELYRSSRRRVGATKIVSSARDDNDSASILQSPMQVIAD